MNNRENQNNKKPILIIVGILITVLVVAASIFGYIYWKNAQREEQAQEIALNFVESLENQEYENLFIIQE